MSFEHLSKVEFGIAVNEQEFWARSEDELFDEVFYDMPSDYLGPNGSLISIFLSKANQFDGSQWSLLAGGSEKVGLDTFIRESQLKLTPTKIPIRVLKGAVYLCVI